MQKNTQLILVAVFLCAYMKISAQDNFNFQAILLDSVLTKNADAIVRSEAVEIVINSMSSVSVRTRRAVTVLNKSGEQYADKLERYDPLIKINKLQVTIYDAVGKEIKKYKKKDFEDRSVYDGSSLAGDDRYKYIEYIPTKYPYTLVFESEVDRSSTAFIQSWMPIIGSGHSVQKSTYKIINSSGVPLRSKEINFKNFSIEKYTTDQEISYTMSNVPVISYEVYSPSYLNTAPIAMVALSEFSLQGVDGIGEDWKTFGKWQYDYLVAGRDQLSEKTIKKVTQLVADANSDKEKAKRIYKYVQDKTRYISIQLGIGGWMPMMAADVDRLGYGDCKALTNYTKALLDSQDITSYYTVVYAGERKRNIQKEFASMQGNHVILNIPDEEEDIWLECTSQTTPFNFIGDFTDDRDVLVIKPEGGEIKHTKKYEPEESTLDTKATVILSEDRSISAVVEMQSKGIQYSHRYHEELKPLKDQKQHYKKYWSYINDMNIDSIELSNDREDILFREKLKINATNYITKAGNRLLLIPNMFNREDTNLPKYADRKRPLVISRGFVDTDEYLITIPEGYDVSLPEKKTIETDFGSFSSQLEKVNDTQLQFKRVLKINDGVYAKEEYETYRTFRQQIKKIDKSKIVLKQLQ
ncbi:hypothetical protein GCM10022393_28670 [Aquimarina addita]|uniref:DUF3857 domain-containing protein n=1 Tax=Aquimarina addita TaxID=870485 RepID=A0ABP6UMI2_9FLAO